MTTDRSKMGRPGLSPDEATARLTIRMPESMLAELTGAAFTREVFHTVKDVEYGAPGTLGRLILSAWLKGKRLP